MQVLRTALSNRLAKVQGWLFRAAFLTRAPLFMKLITENLILCFLQSLFLSTTKYLTGALSLRFRKILTNRIHSDYFQVTMHIQQGLRVVELLTMSSILNNFIRDVICSCVIFAGHLRYLGFSSIDMHILFGGRT